MTLANRMRLRASATGLGGLLILAIWAGLGRGGGAAPAPGDADKSSAEVLKALKGTWVPAEDQGLDSRWTFEGATLKATVNGADYTCKVKVDPKAKPHATIDFLIEDGPEDSKGKTSKSIYKLDGEKLTLCVSLPGRGRPKAFEQIEDEAYLFELKKEKKAEKEEKRAKKG